MNIMNLYVYENRNVSNDLSKPILLENLNVDNVQIHIPKEIDGTDMGTWAWWFVYQNAKREKYSIPMTLEGTTNDEGEEEYISTVGLNHGFTGKHGTVMYAIEALQADGSGTVTHEWHTKTCKLEVVYTLQGNQTEYDESETDIISALINRVSELITSGAEIADLADVIEGAAATAQEVIDSIPQDYSALSSDVDDLKADLEDLDDRVEALESGSGGSGLSSTQKRTLMDVINALGGAFTTPSAQSLVDAFNSAWNVAVTGISLNKSTLSFSALTSETLRATLSPSDATGTVTWVSSNTSVATVDSNGTVVVVGNGTATITASCGGYSATCAVTVSGIATTYTVTYNLTGCESSNPQTRAEEGSTFTASITPVVGYLLPFTAYTVTMGGTDITASAWSSGTVSVAEVTGDIVISATATVDSRTLLYAWDLTQSLIDTVDNTEATLINTVTAGNLPTRDSSGLHFTEAGQVAQFVTLDEIASKVIEMDIASMDFKGDASRHIRLLDNNNNYDNAAHSLLIRRSTGIWTAYENGWQTPTAVSGQTIPSDPNAFSGHTVSCEISSSRSMTVYVDGTPIYIIPNVYNFGRSIAVGGTTTGTQNDGQQIFDCTITGLRIYSI